MTDAGFHSTKHKSSQPYLRNEPNWADSDLCNSSRVGGGQLGSHMVSSQFNGNSHRPKTASKWGENKRPKSQISRLYWALDAVWIS